MDEALAYLETAVDNLGAAIFRLSRLGQDVTEMQAIRDDLNDRLVKLEDQQE